MKLKEENAYCHCFTVKGVNQLTVCDLQLLVFEFVVCVCVCVGVCGGVCWCPCQSICVYVCQDKIIYIQMLTTPYKKHNNSAHKHAIYAIETGKWSNSGWARSNYTNSFLNTKDKNSIQWNTSQYYHHDC